MTRGIRVDDAPFGAISRSDSKQKSDARLLAPLRQAGRMGRGLVVFPEPAPSTFFPRRCADRA